LPRRRRPPFGGRENQRPERLPYLDVWHPFPAAAGIDTWSAVNKAPKARLVLVDGSPAERDFPISNLDVFVPGRRIEIAAGYGGQNQVIFQGTVVKQGIEVREADGAKLIVDIIDPAVKMTLARSSAIFAGITDSDLIGKLVAHGGVIVVGLPSVMIGG
jgi:hypothetical protein